MRKLKGDVMPFVDQLKDKARNRLLLLPENTPLLEVARLLHAGNDFVIVCAPSGRLAGVLTKTDLVEYIAMTERLDHTVKVASVAKTKIVTCRLEDDLHDVWKLMRVHDLKNIPVVDAADRPIGVVNARDALQILLSDTENEEKLLRDYVMGLGYR